MINRIPTLAWSCLPDGTPEFLNQRWLDYTGLSLRERGRRQATRGRFRIQNEGGVLGTEAVRKRDRSPQPISFGLTKISCTRTVPKPYVIAVPGVTSSEKQIPRNC
jgi:hypothetical protein